MKKNQCSCCGLIGDNVCQTVNDATNCPNNPNNKL